MSEGKAVNSETLSGRIERLLTTLAVGEEAELDLYMLRKRKASSVPAARCSVSIVAKRLGLAYYTRVDGEHFIVGRL